MPRSAITRITLEIERDGRVHRYPVNTAVMLPPRERHYTGFLYHGMPLDVMLYGVDPKAAKHVQPG